MNNMYCKKCGSELVMSKIFHGHEQETGKKLFIHRYKCPKIKTILSFGHSSGNIGKDYSEIFITALFYESGDLSSNSC